MLLLLTKLSQAKILLHAGSDPHLKDYVGLTAFDHASRNEHADMFDLLSNFELRSPKPKQQEQERTGHGPLIWIDSICIDSRNNSERSAQVRVMDRIYTEAGYVVVWLGREDDLSKRAVEAVQKLYAIFTVSGTHLEKLMDSDIIPYGKNDPELFRSLEIPVVDAADWMGLAALYLRQYFRRTWTLQESVLACDSVAFLGTRVMPWFEFLMVTCGLSKWQSRFNRAQSASFQKDVTYPIETHAQLIWNLRWRNNADGLPEDARKMFLERNPFFSRGENKQSSLPLLDLLMETFMFSATDPRDRIYGLLGIASRNVESPQIYPDYDKPVEKLYAEVTRLIIAHLAELGTPKLETIAMVRDSQKRSIPSLPTWVPEFGLPNSAFWSNSYDAASRIELAEASEGRWNQLKVLGMRVDTIVAAANLRPAWERVTLFTLNPSWFSLVSRLSNPYPFTGQPRTEVLWRTLCGDQTLAVGQTPGTGQVPAPDEYGEQFKSLVCTMVLSERTRMAYMAPWAPREPVKEGKERQESTNLSFRPSPRSSAMLEETSPHSAFQSVEADLLPPLLEADSVSSDQDFPDPRLQPPHVQATLRSLEQLACDEGCSTPDRQRLVLEGRLPKYRYRYTMLDGQEPVAVFQNNHNNSDFVTAYTTRSGQRRLYITKRGYLGLGPMSLKEGDEVWVLAGSRVPFVLRRKSNDDGPDNIQKQQAVPSGEATAEGSHSAPGSESATSNEATARDKRPVYRAVEDHQQQQDNEGNIRHGHTEDSRPIYQLIGDSYVHGIMQGEAVEGVQREDFISIVLE